jgi:flagellar basal-body rod protein FlgF
MDAQLIAYSRQKALYRKLDTIANNVANAESTGFKSEIFVEVDDNKKINGQQNPTTENFTSTDFKEGGLNQTNRPLDVAIDGDGFFQVDTPLGARYTRNGSFQIDASGNLVSKEGYVLSGGGAITFQPGDSDIRIGEDGTVLATNAAGQVEDKGIIGIVKFTDKASLKKAGDGFFSSTETPEQAIYLEDYKVAQGVLESSNVNRIGQLTDMIEVSRSAKQVAKIIDEQHSILRDSFSRLTKVE